ncbi:TPA: CotH kinase family protein [Klebsiella pneumoniae]
MAFNPPLGSTTPAVFIDNVKRLELLINGPADNVADRAGDPLYSWREIQRSLVPLGRQYMTLADALADIANIPNGSSTYVRSQGGESIADEYINNGGALEPTGRKMPSQRFVAETITALQGVVTSVSVLAQAVNINERNILDIYSSTDRTEDKLTGMLSGICSLTDSVSEIYPELPSEEERLRLLMLACGTAEILNALDGFDPQSRSGGGDSLIHPTIPGLYMLPEPAGLVHVNVDIQTVPTSKEAPPVKGIASVSCGGGIIQLYCLVSVQGATSSNYPKKNLNIEFYPDSNFDDTVDVKIGSLLPHDEWVYKANWIDFTHVRNLMSYRLWHRVMNSRNGFPKWDVDNSYLGLTGVASAPTGATGHPDGFPCVLTVGNEFYGIGDLMIGNKRANYNLPKNDTLKIQLDFGDWFDITKFDNPAAYEFKAPKNPTDETKNAINSWVAFCALAGEDFNNAINAKLDKNNVIDFILFIQLIAATDLIQDNRGKNVQFVSYDGVKWFFMPYDLDTTFGLYWDGKGIHTNTSDDMFTGSFWKKIISYYSADINARYQFLRRTGVYSVDTLYEIANGLSCRYSEALWKAESKNWTVPSGGFATLEQIYSWATRRLTWMDTKYSYSDN